MTDATTPAKPRITNTFAEILAPIQPEELRNQLLEKLDEALAAFNENNKRVARLRESKNTDPENVEYQDITWKRVAEEESTDPELTAEAEKYWALNEEIEQLIKSLREKSRKHMKPALSDDEKKKERKLLDEGKAVIDTLKISAKAFADMADTFLKPIAPIEGGVWSLMPNVESVLNTRGRKSGTGKQRSEDGYASRIGSIAVDGKDIGKGEGADRKTSWPMVAQELSDRFNGSRFEGNKVTALEIEEALYKALGAEFRDKSALKDIEFTFTKHIEVQNPNDDTTKVEPQTVKIEFAKWVKPEAVEKVEDNKIENNEAPANEAPVKKVASSKK